MSKRAAHIMLMVGILGVLLCLGVMGISANMVALELEDLRARVASCQK